MATLDFLKKIKTPAREARPIPIHNIIPDPDQPRRTHHAVDGMVPEESRESLELFAANIAEQGLDQPITVRELPDGKYMIIMGERRWRAFKINNEKGVPDSDAIPAFVRSDLAGSELRLAQLRENLQREDLTDLEVANFIKQTLDDDPSLQKKKLAQLLHVSSQKISTYLALLDRRWAAVVDPGYIEYASLLELFRTLPEESRASLVDTAKREGRKLTSGDIRAEKAKAKNPPAAPPSSAPAASARNSSTEQDAEGESGRVGPSLANEVAQLLSQNSPKGENYQPSRAISEMRPASPRIKDTGGSATIPDGPEAIDPALLEKREVKLTLEQLLRLSSYEAAGDVAKVASMMMPVAEIRAAILALGGELPEDDNLLVMTLMKALNSAE
jgi:ParB family chromosome partitioning protein